MLAIGLFIASMRHNKVRGICLVASIWLNLGILAIILYSFFGVSKAHIVTQRTTFLFLRHSTSSDTVVNSANLFESNGQIGLERISIQRSPSQNLAPKLSDEPKLSFFSALEVDSPAAPVGEWVIDWTSWPSGESQTISFTLWTDETGKIIEWKLLGAIANLNQIEKAMSAIVDTPMNPAVLNGLPVPSVQTIELEFVPD